MDFQPRYEILVGWRRAHDAKRDAARVFTAARDGRPLELDKRLKLGKLAGGLNMKGNAHNGRLLLPMEAAILG